MQGARWEWLGWWAGWGWVGKVLSGEMSVGLWLRGGEGLYGSLPSSLSGWGGKEHSSTKLRSNAPQIAMMPFGVGKLITRVLEAKM